MGQAEIHDDDALMGEIHWKIIDKCFFEFTADCQDREEVAIEL